MTMPPEQVEELVRTCETYLSLFETEGWKQFIKELESTRTLYREQDYYNAEGIEKFNQAKGYLKCLDQILAFETIIKASADQFQKVGGGMQDPLRYLLEESENTLEM